MEGRNEGRNEGRKRQSGQEKEKKNSMRASTVPCGIQVVCGERVLDRCHKRASQKTAKRNNMHSDAQNSPLEAVQLIFYFFWVVVVVVVRGSCLTDDVNNETL